MIYYCEAPIADIQKHQKEYPWQRPVCCPHCEARLWGHGFVDRFFNGIKNALPIKRWICSQCKKVITARPKRYWCRFQESISGIFDALKERVRGGRWPPWCPRQRGGHWLRKLNHNSRKRMIKKKSSIELIEHYRVKNLVIF